MSVRRIVALAALSVAPPYFATTDVMGNTYIANQHMLTFFPISDLLLRSLALH